MPLTIPEKVRGQWRTRISDHVIWIAFFFSLTGVAGLGLLAHYVLERTSHSEEWALNAAVAVAKVEALHQTLVEAESTGRAFLVGGDPQHRASYEKLLAEINDDLGGLRSRAASDTARKELIAQMELHIERRFAYLSGVMEVRASAGFEAMQQASVGFGIREMRSISAIVEKLKEAERRMLAEGIDVRRRQNLMLKYALAVLIVAGIGIMSAIFWYMNRLWVANRRSAASASHMALHDSLTGLPNRRLLHDRVAVAIDRARRGSTMFAVLFLDLDGFKSVNDDHGHATGDDLLRVTGVRLKGLLRGEDTVARLGGDEFVVVLSRVEEIADAELVADKIITHIAAPYHLEGRQVFISASVGMALYPVHGSTPAELFKSADTALYRAKNAGRERYVMAGPHGSAAASGVSR